MFWGSEAFLIVSMGHSLWYHWGQKKLVTIILKWKHLELLVVWFIPHIDEYNETQRDGVNSLRS